jgi:hypothetical protein
MPDPLKQRRHARPVAVLPVNKDPDADYAFPRCVWGAFSINRPTSAPEGGRWVAMHSKYAMSGSPSIPERLFREPPQRGQRGRPSDPDGSLTHARDSWSPRLEPLGELAAEKRSTFELKRKPGNSPARQRRRTVAGSRRAARRPGSRQQRLRAHGPTFPKCRRKWFWLSKGKDRVIRHFGRGCGAVQRARPPLGRATGPAFPCPCDLRAMTRARRALERGGASSGSAGRALSRRRCGDVLVADEHEQEGAQRTAGHRVEPVLTPTAMLRRRARRFSRRPVSSGEPRRQYAGRLAVGDELELAPVRSRTTGERRGRRALRARSAVPCRRRSAAAVGALEPANRLATASLSSAA